MRAVPTVHLLVAVAVLLALFVTAQPCSTAAAAALVPAGQGGEDEKRAMVVHGSVHGHAIVSGDRQVAAIRGMSGKQLRRFLRDRGARCTGCVEKEHLLEQAIAVRAWPTSDDYVAADLTPSTNSAATHLALHHITDLPSDGSVPAGATVLLEEPAPPATGDYIVGDRYCNQRLINGTQFCHSVSAMSREAQKAMVM